MYGKIRYHAIVMFETGVVLRKLILIVICIILTAVLAGCAAPAAPEMREFFAMDTIMSITAYGPAASSALDAAESEVNALDALLSSQRQDSEISRVNRASDGAPVKVSPDTMDILMQAVKYGGLTGGALDISIYPLSAAWNIQSDHPMVLSDADISALLPLVDYNKIQLDKANATAFLPVKGMGIDLGAVGKGYASDKLMELFKHKGVARALFSLGGNVGCLGGRPDGTPWRVGIRDPKGTANDYLGYVSIKDGFVITSGDYERFFIQNGIRYFHILDPRTGKPAWNGVRSVSIIADNGTMADAYSTALFVMGLDKALAYQKAQGGFEAIFVMEDGRVITTPGAKALFTFTGKDAGYTYEG